MNDDDVKHFRSSNIIIASSDAAIGTICQPVGCRESQSHYNSSNHGSSAVCHLFSQFVLSTSDNLFFLGFTTIVDSGSCSFCLLSMSGTETVLKDFTAENLRLSSSWCSLCVWRLSHSNKILFSFCYRQTFPEISGGHHSDFPAN